MAAEKPVGGVVPELLTEAQARALLDAQRELRDKGYRANILELRKWSQLGDVWKGALRNVPSVGFIIEGRHLRRANSRIPSASKLIEAPLAWYGPHPRKLCPEDYLRNEFEWEHVLGTCCLIGSRRVLTARHVIYVGAVPRDLSDLFVVFDFYRASDGYPTRIFELGINVFGIKSEGPGGDEDPCAGDWLTLNLDESPPIPAHEIPGIAGTSVGGAVGVYTLGHPNGLPMRFGYSPTSNPSLTRPGCYNAFVDGYNSASGSPVFDAATHQIVGVLILSCGTQNTGVLRTPRGCQLSQICAPEAGTGGSFFVDSQYFVQKASMP